MGHKGLYRAELDYREVVDKPEFCLVLRSRVFVPSEKRQY